MKVWVFKTGKRIQAVADALALLPSVDLKVTPFSTHRIEDVTLTEEIWNLFLKKVLEEMLVEMGGSSDIAHPGLVMFKEMEDPFAEGKLYHQVRSKEDVVTAASENTKLIAFFLPSSHGGVMEKKTRQYEGSEQDWEQFLITSYERWDGKTGEDICKLNRIRYDHGSDIICDICGVAIKWQCGNAGIIDKHLKTKSHRMLLEQQASVDLMRQFVSGGFVRGVAENDNSDSENEEDDNNNGDNNNNNNNGDHESTGNSGRGGTSSSRIPARRANVKKKRRPKVSMIQALNEATQSVTRQGTLLNYIIPEPSSNN